MRKSSRGGSRFPGRRTAAAGLVALAGAGAALAVELRHRAQVARDPEWPLLSAPLAGGRVPVLSADGALLHAEVFGAADAPTFVLIPGWTEELQIFDLVVRELLERGFRVVGYDPRGQGSSDRSADLDQRIERYGEDLSAVLAATCAGRDDVVIAGHSMGGMSIVAWAASVDVAAHARAVALVSSGASGLDEVALLPESIPADLRRRVLTPLLLSDRPMIPLSTPVSRAVGRYVMFGPDGTAAQLEFAERMTRRMHGRLRAAAARTLRDLDLSAALERVTVPALVVVGEGDRLTPPAQARRMVAGLPRVAEFLLMPRTGHMVPLERPLELAEALVRLAESVGLSVAGAVAASGSAAG